MDPSRRRFFFGSRTHASTFRPPWSLPDDAFIAVCTRCGECIPACPTGLIVRGDGGFPVTDFAAAACTFCGRCAAACASGAIGRDRTRSPWSYSIRIGDGCLAHRRVECRVCGESCETGAIRFGPAPGGVSRPRIDDAACTGCGACLAPCPVDAIARIPLPPLRPPLFPPEPT